MTRRPKSTNELGVNPDFFEESDMTSEISETGVNIQGGSLAEQPLLSPHEAMRRAMADASNSLPEQTHKLRDLCDCYLRVVGVYGPRNLGKGDVYALDLLDADGRIYTTYCGSKQIIDQLGVAGLKEYVQDPQNAMSIWFSYHPRFSGSGEDLGYYTMRAHFADVNDTRPQLVSFSGELDPSVFDSDNT